MKPGGFNHILQSFHENVSKHIGFQVTIIHHYSLVCNLCADIPRLLEYITANPGGQIIVRVSCLFDFLIFDLYMKTGREHFQQPPM